MTKHRTNDNISPPAPKALRSISSVDYGRLVSDISGLLEQARRTVVRSANSILTATYWDIGRRIVEFEQGGRVRAAYGEELLVRLSADLATKHGRGFSARNLRQMRAFYLGWEIWQTPSATFEARAKCQTLSGTSGPAIVQTPSGLSLTALVPARNPNQPPTFLTGVFPLSWSQYVRLLSVEKLQARAFYESEAIRGGWSVRQ